MSEQTEIYRGAQISDCGKFRYSLTRCWDSMSHQAIFIGLNPSTADGKLDDPTIRRCAGFARLWGYGGIIMLNLFAYRATQPWDMMHAEDPIGPDNDRHLNEYAQERCVIAAWGTGGNHLARNKRVRAIFQRLHYLRLTKDGHPAHPLYLPKMLTPILWSTP